ncbi:hypothetical protein METP3_03741 [Methanosarcinales archaeon]|nr:hypothetical protein METP3_03741 [Methanosarcinales archaeon]
MLRTIIDIVYARCKGSIHQSNPKTPFNIRILNLTIRFCSAPTPSIEDGKLQSTEKYIHEHVLDYMGVQEFPNVVIIKDITKYMNF